MITRIDAKLIPWFLMLIVCGVASSARRQVEPQSTDVFVSATNGHDTYRLPALLVTGKGALPAFCEGRKSSRSATGDVDPLVKKHPYERIVFASFSRDWLTSANTEP